MTPQQRIEILEEISTSPEELRQNVATSIATVVEKIKFLEGIYRYPDNLRFSVEFCDCALKEQQRLCQLSSKLYSYQRDNASTLTALQAPAGA